MKPSTAIVSPVSTNAHNAVKKTPMKKARSTKPTAKKAGAKKKALSGKTVAEKTSEKDTTKNTSMKKTTMKKATVKKATLSFETETVTKKRKKVTEDEDYSADSHEPEAQVTTRSHGRSILHV